ncbi:hypothetical protein PU634_10520 [Oceanimonas pelagia]|uniref:Uncharacterized protein n=1 Tax=Oceanimonas pelagia TaxID=3028314 RepID=A0AA50Q6M6_9GAMM|nr:hypothetical protein [Oceanimonas pelagia]WMC09550.1 hypothetical protein PU634_10520 [Oceanimonas pelagia]
MPHPFAIEDFESLTECSDEKLYKLAHKAYDYHLDCMRAEREARLRFNDINKELIRRNRQPLLVRSEGC